MVQRNTRNACGIVLLTIQVKHTKKQTFLLTTKQSRDTRISFWNIFTGVRKQELSVLKDINRYFSANEEPTQLHLNQRIPVVWNASLMTTVEQININQVKQIFSHFTQISIQDADMAYNDNMEDLSCTDVYIFIVKNQSCVTQ